METQGRNGMVEYKTSESPDVRGRGATAGGARMMDTDLTPALGTAGILRGLPDSDDRFQFTEQQARLADLLYGASLGPAPASVHRHKWMTDIQVGDTVVELSSRSVRRWQDRIGVLLRVHDEPIVDEDGEVYGRERYWTIRTCEREFRWHNAQLVRVPATDHDARLFEGWGERCVVVTDCQNCARERWRKAGSRWEQGLRR